MNYIETVNGYAIFECSEKICKESGYCYPTFAAFLDHEDIKLGREECSLETYKELAEWCIKN